MSTSDSSSPALLAFAPTVALEGFSPFTAATFASAGGEFDGVVRISDGSVFGSGTLLSTGRHILTAAHVVEDAGADQLRVFFTLLGGIVSVPVTRVMLHPGWTDSGGAINDDVAVLELASAAPASAQRHDLYTGTDEIGQDFTLVGFGAATGAATDTSEPTRRAGKNTFDSDATLFSAEFGWNISPSRQLLFDFDDGTAAHDAFGAHFGLADTGLGALEAMITPGDSGGPAFLEKDGELLIAGINSYVARPSNSLSDVDGIVNSSIGEFGGLMRASAFLAWIDSVTGVERVVVGQTGTRPDRDSVPKTVAEGGVTWFLVEIGAAQAVEVSVHYATRNGTAKAGEDYLAAQGDIVLAPGQTWARVTIETLADARLEGSETFSLVLTNPKGGHFPSGQTELVATRTIADNLSLATLVGVDTQIQDGLLG